jgi:glycine/D-amino acid oxidase-like deaminating enzyme
MAQPDWIVVGGGLSGGAIAYELSLRGAQVLVLERQPVLEGPSRYSYGGIAWWSGTTDFQQNLLQAGLERQRQLGQELACETGFQDCDLLLPIPVGQAASDLLPAYQAFAVQPEVLTPRQAHTLEPELSPTALESVLRLPHARVTAAALVEGYRQAALGLGAQWMTSEVVNLPCQQQQVVGVETHDGLQPAGGVILAAGAASRQWLTLLDCQLPLYFTWAEAIATLPSNTRLQTIVMPVQLQRFGLEAAACDPAFEPDWRAETALDLLPAILDAGAAPLDDQRLLLGQVSRIRPSLSPDWPGSSQMIRQALRPLLPRIAALPGQIVTVPVAFTRDQMPYVGLLPGWQNLALFTGFSSPFAYVPILAQQFADHLTGAGMLPRELSPARHRED